MAKREQIVVERHVFEALEIFEVSGQELDLMERETLSISEDFSFALAGLSVGVTIATVLLTVKLESDRVYEGFFLAMVLGFLVTLYCGIRWFKGRRRFRGAVHQIKRRTSPLGEQGRENDPTVLLEQPQQRPGGQ
jgi:hypothetical protein